MDDKERKMTIKKRVYNRRSLGWDEKDLYKPARKYKRLSEDEQSLLDKNGISKEIFYNRIHAGWNRDKALNKPLRKYTRITEQEKKWMEESGVDSLTFRTRIARNMSREDAAKKPKKSNRNQRG